MKILIEDDKFELALSNENFNVDNFVSIEIGNGDDGITMDVPISDLYTAVKALYEHRTREREADKLL